ncbi:isopentenyl-diphosphate delta-isomerase [Psychrobacter sp. PL19]|uniref:isopentenyl-diphosphate Delta-isomerase n=1 Tax=Psychrobacter sp. PL19 TaxID=2760711 RepID=UPI001AE3B1CF
MNKTEGIDLLTLVNTKGEITGYAEKIETHLRGELHLAFSLMIIRSRGADTEYLLQQRALHKYHSGGLWANTCCSHPQPNEGIKDAAQRRVAEELGITSALNLSTIGQIQYKYPLDNQMIEHELDNIVIANVDDIEWQQNPDEVMDVKWWKERDLVKLLHCEPTAFVAWFPMVFDFIKKNQLSLSSSL